MKTVASLCGVSLCFAFFGCGGVSQPVDLEDNVADQSDRLEATNYCSSALGAVAGSATVGAGGAITFGTTQGFIYKPGAGGAVEGGPTPYLFAVVGGEDGGEGLMTVRGPQGSAGTAYFCTYNVNANGKLTLANQRAGNLIAGTQVTKAVGPGQVLLVADQIPVLNYRVFASMVDFVGSCSLEQTWTANKLNAGSTSITVNGGAATGLASNTGVAFDEYYSYLSSTYQYDAADSSKDDTLIAADITSGGARGRFLACEFARASGASSWSSISASDLILAGRYPATLDSVDSGGADVLTWASAATPAGAGSDRVMLVSLAQSFFRGSSFTARVSLSR